MEVVNNVIDTDNKKKYSKEWYEKNKKRHLEYMSEQINCKCGSVITRGHYNKHLKTEIHKKKLKEIKTINNLNKNKNIKDFEKNQKKVTDKIYELEKGDIENIKKIDELEKKINALIGGKI